MSHEDSERFSLMEDLVSSVEVDLTSSSDNGVSFMVLGNVDTVTLIGLGLITEKEADENK